jgi:hypothetical protein
MVDTAQSTGHHFEAQELHCYDALYYYDALTTAADTSCMQTDLCTHLGLKIGSRGVRQVAGRKAEGALHRALCLALIHAAAVAELGTACITVNRQREVPSPGITALETVSHIGLATLRYESGCVSAIQVAYSHN